MTGQPQPLAPAAQLEEKKLKSSGLQLGLAYEDGPLQAQLLYTQIDSDTIAGPDVRTMFPQIGYRLDKWTPYLGFASSQDQNAIATTGPPDLPLFAPLEWRRGADPVEPALDAAHHDGGRAL